MENRRKLSTEIASCAHLIGEERTLERMAKAGFEAWDFSMFAMFRVENGKAVPKEHPLATREAVRFAQRLRRVGLDNGLVCNQSHAPFPVYVDGAIDYVKRAIECTAEAGGRICVVHPANLKSAEENAEMFQELLPLAKAAGIRLATENMWCWDREQDHATRAACSDPADFCAHLDAVNDPDLVACLDLGHAEMRGLNTTAVEMIEALGDRLQALHIHDNDQWHDSHQLPFTMQMDFAAITQALARVGYRGDITLEADQYLKAYTPETVFEGLLRMAEAAKRIRSMLEETEETA